MWPLPNISKPQVLSPSILENKSYQDHYVLWATVFHNDTLKWPYKEWHILFSTFNTSLKSWRSILQLPSFHLPLSTHLLFVKRQKIHLKGLSQNDRPFHWAFKEGRESIEKPHLFSNRGTCQTSVLLWCTFVDFTFTIPPQPKNKRHKPYIHHYCFIPRTQVKLQGDQ